jgi:succinate-acetate transporter protein
MTESRVSPAQRSDVQNGRVPDSEAVAEVRAPIGATVLADPAPLGLAAFGMTTFMLSVFNADLLPASLTGSVLALALMYGGAGQLLAGMWEFRNGNTFGAVAFTSFGAFWLAYWYYVDHIVKSLPAAEVHKSTGLFLLGWAIFTAYMTIASLRTNGATAAVFVALTVTFILLTIGAFGDNTNMTKAGGYVGLVTAFLAAYTSFAGVTNATFKRVILPVFPLSS